MVLPESAAEALRWALTLLLPLLLALLLPGAGMAARTRRWLKGLQVLGLVLALIGVITPLLLFPVVVVLMFCAIFSGLLQILSQFTASFSCPELPLAAQADVLIQPGLALSVFATARRWLLRRKLLKRRLPGHPVLEPQDKIMTVE
ncbi:hypothetical protein [Synechococcus sp. CBW1107]|uniref:hypothetical protein n=1 Tax=Synechococcus sp. CBW1107 TaxID=2789857 RepID=UPI002AD1EDE1|nr:hypothetical protein [Synechococcus sp. CBW1107]CAK6698950.1 hypothetical protein ICNINCKA_02542 [Synechococcus sp. CBW1107]